ncbi:MAG: glycoside hydrolase family protein [Armatimonadota bacterium]
MKYLLYALVACVLLACPVFADRQTDLSSQWMKNGKDVLRGFTNMYNPHIIHEPRAEYPFKIWFFGWASADGNPGSSGCDAIFHARAKTLDKWEVYSRDGKWDTTMTPSKWVPVITAQDKIYDSWHNGDPSVVKRNGIYYMAYSSTGYENSKDHPNGPKPTDRYIYSVMGAKSKDGIHWTKTERAILMHEPDLDLPPSGESTTPMHGMYHRPSLMFDNGKWKCWFDYWTESGISMGYAECPSDKFMNPSAWKVVRAGSNPLLKEWPNPDVIKVGRKYYAYSDPGGYTPPGWPSRHIAEAVSDDGINWTVTGHIPPEADTPATHVPEAFVMKENGRAKIILFYGCQIGGDPYDYRYDRIRYMWRWVDSK